MSEKLRGLLVKVGENPIAIDIEYSYAKFRKLINASNIDFYTDPVDMPDAIAVIDDEFMFNDKPFNGYIGSQIINGDFIIFGKSTDEYGTYDISSLTDEQFEKYIHNLSLN